MNDTPPPSTPETPAQPQCVLICRDPIESALWIAFRRMHWVFYGFAVALIVLGLLTLWVRNQEVSDE